MNVENPEVVRFTKDKTNNKKKRNKERKTEN